jgi:hypothetical protein
MSMKGYFKELGWRRVGLAVLFFLAAAILEVQSALQSAEFHSGIATGWWGTLLAVGGAALDYGQIGFPVAAIVAWGKKRRVLCSLFWILTIFVSLYSLFTSMAANINWNNQSINEISVQAQKNTVYQKSSKQFDIASSSVEQLQSMLNEKVSSKKTDAEKIRSEYISKIEHAKKIRYIDANNNGVVDSVREFESERDKRIAKLDTDISDLQKQIDSKLNHLDTTKKEMASVVSSTRPTRGVMGIAESISKDDPESTALRINLAKETLVVLAGMFFAIGVGVLLDSSQRIDILFPTSPDGKPKKKWTDKLNDLLQSKQVQPATATAAPSPAPKASAKRYKAKRKSKPNENQAKTSEQVKFKNLTLVEGKKNDKFNQNVKEYIKVMENPEAPGTCRGYQTIAKILRQNGIQVTDYQASKIKGHLEEMGLIKVVDGVTVMVKRKSQLA